MGVDYDAKYGIGYEICPNHDNECDYEYFDIESYLDDIVNKYSDILKLTYFQTGEGDYTGDTNEYYLCVKNPFKDGYDLTKIKNKLDKIIRDEGLETVGKFGLVGGLHVY